MKTTEFGRELVRAAESVLAIGYRAGKRNLYGEKLEQIVLEYDAAGIGSKMYKGKGKAQLDYCGITVSVIIDRAVRALKAQKNKFRSASAKWFLDEAKRQKIRVDYNPQPGCLFVTKRSGGSGYHVGMIWQIKENGKYVQTIEGNTYCGSCFFVQNGCKTKLNNEEYGIVTRLRPNQKGAKYAPETYIHIEELYGKNLLEFPESEAMLADSRLLSNNDYYKLPPTMRLNDEPPAEGTFCYTDEILYTGDGGEGVNLAGEKTIPAGLIIGASAVIIASGIFGCAKSF